MLQIVLHPLLQMPLLTEVHEEEEFGALCLVWAVNLERYSRAKITHTRLPSAKRPPYPRHLPP